MKRKGHLYEATYDFNNIVDAYNEVCVPGPGPGDSGGPLRHQAGGSGGAERDRGGGAGPHRHLRCQPLRGDRRWFCHCAERSHGGMRGTDRHLVRSVGVHHLQHHQAHHL